MSARVRRSIIQVAIGLALGGAMAVAIGWWLWPVEYTNTAPDVLRRDYRDDYVVMVAGAYAVEGDLDEARRRLALLDADDPAAPVVNLGERLVAVRGNRQDIVHLARLAWDLRAITPALTPYLEGGS